MKYDSIKLLNDNEFYKLTGVTHDKFNNMVSVLKDEESKKKSFGGKPNILIIEDRLLMTLKYISESKSFSSVALLYNISESSCNRNINWVIRILDNYEDFRLNKKLKNNKKAGSFVKKNSNVKKEVVMH